MQLTDQQIAEFQALYEKHFGEQISREEAYESATRLIRLLQATYKPMTIEEYRRNSTLI